MKIKAVKFRKNGFYGQPFAFGGEEGTDKFDANIRYRGSLQNYLPADWKCPRCKQGKEKFNKA